MNLTNKNLVKSLCRQYHIKPTRSAGQNFLINQGVLNRIISSSELKKSDQVLEIGAGLGTLTQALAPKVKQIFAVEKDVRFFPHLEKLASQYQNIAIISQDIRELSIKKVFGKKHYKLIANLPYQISSWVLRNFLETEPRPDLIVLCLQKEVAERVVAVPGKMSILSVAVQIYADPQIIIQIPKDYFWPVPEVDSAIVKIKAIQDPVKRWPTYLKSHADVKKLFSLVKIGFSNRRKQLQNNLANGYRLDHQQTKKILEELDLDSQIRAQDLSVEDWLRVMRGAVRGAWCE